MEQEEKHHKDLATPQGKDSLETVVEELNDKLELYLRALKAATTKSAPLK